MRLLWWTATSLVGLCHLAQLAAAYVPPPATAGNGGKVAPKVLIISMFTPEADVWYQRIPTSGLGDLLARNISVPGLSMLFPHVHCLADYSVCQVTVGEAEINAAVTVTSVVLSGKFDLTKTYFLVAGIAGVNPRYGTLGSVALARYAVQVALQYEFDAREVPANFTTGYLAYDTDLPGEYPKNLYGTEVFEVNAALRDVAYSLAARATLADSPASAEYRAKYLVDEPLHRAATEPPSVIKCDASTSDVYFSGALLSEAFENTTSVWTNGSGIYCMTAQEDNATLEVLVRMAIEGLVDFARIIIMRTASDFDRPPPDVTPFDHLRILNQNGFHIAIENIYNAGIEIVQGILADWDCTFAGGIEPTNYIGDVFGSLGGEPDFGPGSLTGGAGVLPGGGSGDLARRSSPGAARPTRRRRRVAVPPQARAGRTGL